MPDVARATPKTSTEVVRRDRLRAFAGDLLRCPTDNPPGDCLDAGARVLEEVVRLGLDANMIEVERPMRPHAPIVLAWAGPRSETPDVVLNAHLDASPPGDAWTVPTYGGVEREGVLYGRGACLSKSDVAAQTYALAAVAGLAATSGRSILLAITADEGDGGHHGPRYLLETLGYRPRRAITPGFTRSVTIAHCGAVQQQLVVRGRPAHQAVVPASDEAMRRAVQAAAMILDEDRNLRDRPCSIPGIASPTLNITRIAGGEFFGMAPGRVELLIDRRVTPEESTADVREGLGRLLERIEERVGGTIAVEVVQVAEPFRPNDAQRPWAETVRTEAEGVLGCDVPLRGVPLYTDARWFAAHGVPTVMYGVGGDDLVEAGINGVDEHVLLDDLDATTEVLVRVLSRVLAGADDRLDEGAPS